MRINTYWENNDISTLFVSGYLSVNLCQVFTSRNALLVLSSGVPCNESNRDDAIMCAQVKKIIMGLNVSQLKTGILHEHHEILLRYSSIYF